MFGENPSFRKRTTDGPTSLIVESSERLLLVLDPICKLGSLRIFLRYPEHEKLFCCLHAFLDNLLTRLFPFELFHEHRHELVVSCLLQKLKSQEEVQAGNQRFLIQWGGGLFDAY